MGKTRVKTVILTVENNIPQAYKSLKSLCYADQRLKYYSIFRKLQKNNPIIQDTLTIYKSTIR